MGEWVSYPKFVSPATKRLHPRVDGEMFIGKQIATPANPPSGFDAIYFKSDGNLYRLTPAGTETKIPLSGDIVNADVDAAAAIAQTKLAAQPGVRVYNTGALPIAGPTLTTLTFDSERFDTDTMHTPGVPSRLTATTAGVYLIVASVRWATNATGFRQLALLLNGTTYIASVEIPAASGAPTDMDITTIYQLTAGQYVEAQAAQGSGGSLNVSVTGNFSPEFMMVRMSG